MAIITMSMGSYGKGREIAEKVADRLGYECVSRDALFEASHEFHIPEIRLMRAPTVLDRFPLGKARYVAFLQKALFIHVQKDNVVYHGLAGHFFLKNVRHVLKVRVIAETEDRVQWRMERENISKDEALRLLNQDDCRRRSWTLAVHGIDTTDPALYDLVVHLRRITTDDAVEIISHTAGLPQFETKPESQQTLDDLVLAARVKILIIRLWPAARVEADRGSVVILGEALLGEEGKVHAEISSLARTVPGVEDVRVSARPTTAQA